MVQETFVTAFLKLEKAVDPDQFEAWLKTNAANECRRWRRHRCISETDETVLVSSASSPEDKPGAESRRAALDVIRHRTAPSGKS